MAISDVINKMIEIALTGAKITSASPGHINTVFLLEEMDHPELEDEIRSIVEEEINLTKVDAKKSPDSLTDDDVSVELKKEVNFLTETQENFMVSPLGTLTSLTRSQTAVLQSFAKNPFEYLLTTFFKKMPKGTPHIIVILAVLAAVKIVIAELMKPGRLLDRRFKRLARDEILLFNSREDQAELRQGFRTVTVTTMPFLKGAELRGQISGNLYNPTAITMNRLDPRRVISPIMSTQNSSRGSRFGRFGRR